MGRTHSTSPGLMVPRTAYSDSGEPLSRRITPDGRILNAFEKARAMLKLGKRCYKCGPRYEVESESLSPKSRYLRQAPNGAWICSCPAGEVGNPCYHWAMLMLRFERESHEQRGYYAWRGLTDEGGELLADEYRPPLTDEYGEIIVPEDYDYVPEWEQEESAPKRTRRSRDGELSELERMCA